MIVNTFGVLSSQLNSIRNDGEETPEECPICQDTLGQRAGQEVVILGCLHRVSAEKAVRIGNCSPLFKRASSVQIVSKDCGDSTVVPFVRIVAPKSNPQTKCERLRP